MDVEATEKKKSGTSTDSPIKPRGRPAPEERPPAQDLVERPATECPPGEGGGVEPSTPAPEVAANELGDLHPEEGARNRGGGSDRYRPRTEPLDVVIPHGLCALFNWQNGDKMIKSEHGITTFREYFRQEGLRITQTPGRRCFLVQSEDGRVTLVANYHLKGTACSRPDARNEEWKALRRKIVEAYPDGRKQW